MQVSTFSSVLINRFHCIRMYSECFSALILKLTIKLKIFRVIQTIRIFISNYCNPKFYIRSSPNIQEYAGSLYSPCPLPLITCVPMALILEHSL